jgi:type I restriction enzyme S subunit
MEEPFSVIQNVFPIRGIPGKTDTKFLFYASGASVTQDGYKGHFPQFRESIIQIPPLPEQKKIAQILSGIDRVINARRNSAEAIAQIGNFAAEELFQRASIAWKSVKIRDCTRCLWQGINTAADKVEYHETGVPILQAKHITSGKIDPQGSRYLSEEDYNKYKERYQPHAGDILFTNIGTIGKSALVTERPKFLIAWNIFLISPSEEIISEYLQYFLQSLDRRNYFHEYAAGNATKFINKTLISELEVPLPPKEQQSKVCNQIRAINKAEECDRNAIAKYLELKRSLLIDLLSGRKRVSV